MESCPKKYERLGLLVEAQTLEQAERECLGDNEARSQRRKREAARRAELDQQYVTQFAMRVRELFPQCPSGREVAIAEHACLKYSGRIGRSATAKRLDENVVLLAVIAHIRHEETQYDEFLARGYERYEAREKVEKAVNRILARWEAPEQSRT